MAEACETELDGEEDDGAGDDELELTVLAEALTGVVAAGAGTDGTAAVLTTIFVPAGSVVAADCFLAADEDA